MYNEVTKGTVKVVVAVLLIVGPMVLSYPEGLASYRSEAVCVSIRGNGRLPVRAPDFETSRGNGVKMSTYVHKGVIPFSQYWCTVEFQGSKVIEAQSVHKWTF